VTEEPKVNRDAQASDSVKNEITHVKVEVAEFSQRIRNVEKFVDLLKDVSDGAYQLGKEFISNKAETEKRQQEFDDKQHRRGIWILVFLVAIIFCFCMTALLLQENELVKFVLQSSLAVAAGTGIASILKSRSKQKKSE